MIVEMTGNPTRKNKAIVVRPLARRGASIKPAPVVDESGGGEVEAGEALGRWMRSARYLDGIVFRLKVNGAPRAYIARGGAAADIAKIAPKENDCILVRTNRAEDGAEYVVSVRRLMIAPVGAAA